MRTFLGLTVIIGGSLLASSFASAQRSGGPGSADPDDLVVRMMAFDKDKDGKLARAELTDSRLLRIFERADADKDGAVTREELAALAAKERSDDRGFGPGGPGGPGRPGGGPGGPRMGPSRPGEVLPVMLQTRLGLSAEQRSQIELLQKDVDARLAKILTEGQQEQLKEMRNRGPGGPGGGPPGGRGRPGGGPPDGPR